MKKIISLMIVIITLFNFIFCNVAFASDIDADVDIDFNENSTFNINEDDFNATDLKGLAEKGTVPYVNNFGKSVTSTIGFNLLDRNTLRFYCRNISWSSEYFSNACTINDDDDCQYRLWICG